MNKQIDREAEMLKIIEDAREVYANDVTDHTENEYIREGLLNANYRKTEDVAREIFQEIEKHYCINKFGEVVVYHDAITELKKKYTEDRNE